MQYLRSFVAVQYSTGCAPAGGLRGATPRVSLGNGRDGAGLRGRRRVGRQIGRIGSDGVS